ncbi:NUDIX hydrolase [Humibacter antri]
MTHDDLLDRLSALEASDARDAFVRFVTDNGDAALRRDGGPEHVTGSCFVFSPDLGRTLLCFHRKGGFWVQFGGHVEPHDVSIADGAAREAREESGIRNLELLTDAIVDLDRHELGSGFACSAHWDIGFVAVVDPAVRVAVSEESDDVAWFPVDGLPAGSASGLAARLERARAAAQTIGRPAPTATTREPR